MKREKIEKWFKETSKAAVITAMVGMAAYMFSLAIGPAFTVCYWLLKLMLKMFVGSFVSLVFADAMAYIYNAIKKRFCKPMPQAVTE